jgi:hypothetical protein
MAKRQTIRSREHGARSREQGGQRKSALRDLPHGMDLLDRPQLNKGTAFTEEERKRSEKDGQALRRVSQIINQGIQ